MATLNKPRAHHSLAAGAIGTGFWRNPSIYPDREYSLSIGHIGYTLDMSESEAIAMIAGLTKTVIVHKTGSNFDTLRPSDALRRLADILDHGSP